MDRDEFMATVAENGDYEKRKKVREKWRNWKDQKKIQYQKENMIQNGEIDQNIIPFDIGDDDF